MPVVARFCDRAGIEIVWVGSVGRTKSGDEGGSSEIDVGERAALVADQLKRARLGRFDPDPSAPLHERTDEIAISSGPGSLAEAQRWRARIDTLDEGGAGRSIRLSAVADTVADLVTLLGVVDDIVLPTWRFPDLEAAADEARGKAVEAGRELGTLGVAAILPVSIGRTEAEAAVRADADPSFAAFGHPRDVGIFGTLEECQDRVIALAHAGITDLRCILPAAPDVHDVIAQLTAVTVGTTDVLLPGSLRSPAPPPPEGWGGRPDRPPRQRVSDGSRRR